MAASPTNFDTNRLRFGDMIAGIGGLVLFISLFLNWYSVAAKSSVPLGGLPRSADFSGWTFLSFIDILLAICAIAAIGIAVARMANAIPRTLPVSAGLLVLGAGALATLLVLFRLLVIPAGPGVPSQAKDFLDYGRDIGVFIAFIAAIAVLVGGWLTWNEEGRPSPGGAGARGGAPAGGGAIGGGHHAGGYAPQTTAAPAAAAPAATAEPAGQAQPADWYPDPRGEKRLRYWDGSAWTDHTAD